MTLPDAPAPPSAQERINEYWSAHAHAYDAYQVERLEKPGARQLWDRVWGAALPEPPTDVLDVGTGSGNVAILLAGLGHRVTGIDLAPGMLEQARRKAAALRNPPVFTVGDAVAPPFPPASFDVITARYVLWTLRDADRALSRWMELLRPGGRLVAVDSTWYPRGVAAAHRDGTSTRRERDFRAAYGDDVLAQLPLAEAAEIDATAERIRSAGFADVVVDELPELLDLDRRDGVAPGHRVQMQYRISARLP